MKKTALVIGGGLAGLTAASFLAKAGSEVTLIEKSQTFGGRAITTTKNGVHFNLGPHALYRSGQAFKILNELGIEISGGIPKVGGTLAIDGGRKHKLPGEALSLRKFAVQSCGDCCKRFFGSARMPTILNAKAQDWRWLNFKWR